MSFNFARDIVDPVISGNIDLIGNIAGASNTQIKRAQNVGDAIAAGTAADILTGIGGGAAGAGAGAAGAGAAGAGSAAQNAASTTAFSEITALIVKVESFLKSIINPVANVIHSVSSTIQDINDNIIQPIVKPIQEFQQAQNTLIQELHNDMHAGIKGLLKIPSDISTALTGFDATMQRSIATLSAAMLKNNNETVVPAMHAAASGPLLEIHDYYKTRDTDFNLFVQTHRRKNLTDPHAAGYTVDDIAKIVADLESQSGIVGGLANAIVTILGIVPFLIEQPKPSIDVALEETYKAQPFMRLDPATVAQLFRRGLLYKDQALEEIQVKGFSQDRAALLLEMARTYMGVGDILNSYHRGQIDSEVLSHKLGDLGFSVEDVGLLENASWQLPNSAQVVQYLFRGIVDEAQAKVLMRGSGLQDDEIARLTQASKTLAGIGDIIENNDRRGMAHTGWSAPELLSQPPQTVYDAGRQVGLDDSAIEILWQNHFQLLPPSLAVHGWFRGYMSRAQLDAILNKYSIPQDQQQDYIDLQRPLIEYRTLSTLMTRGILDEPTAISKLREYGYREDDVMLMIDYAKGSIKTPKSVSPSSLHGLTQGIIVQLYDAGTLDKENALSLLKEIGLSVEASNLILELQDLKTQAAERKAETDLIVAEALAGAITTDTAQGRLLQIGLTTLELEKAIVQLERGTRKKTKLPGEAQITSMWKKGVIDDPTYAQALSDIGYDAVWVRRIMQLEGAA